MRAVVVLLLVGGAAQAGPWMPGRGHFYLQLRESALAADRRYDAAGKLEPIQLVLDDGTTVATSYRQSLTDLYGEVGLAARLSVLADFQILSAVVQPLAGRPARSAVGLSDLFVGMKLLLFDDEVTAALRAGAFAPIGSPTAAVPLGPGDVRGELSILVGKLFERAGVFVAAELGARLRSSATVGDPQHPGLTVEQAYAHQLVWAAELGWSWRAMRRGADALIIAVKLEGAHSLAKPVEDSLGLLDAPVISYVKLGPELSWAIARGVQLTFGGHYFVDGRALPALGEAVLALGYAR